LLNYFGAKLIENLNQSSSDATGSFMLLNSEGFWLKGLSPEDEWNFMYNNRKDRTLAKRDIKAWKRISSRDADQFSTDHGIYTFATVWPLGRGMLSSTGSGEAFKASDAVLSGKNYSWKIVSLIPNKILSERQTTILLHWLPLYGLVVLFLTFVSLGLVLAANHRKRAEEERLRSKKLQGIVEMAGSVCHEMNQPLQVISGLSELLLVEVPEDNPLYSNLQKIIEQTDRMGEITGKLMNITKYETKGYLKGKIVDIDKAAD
jgi:signal transduction histidine kinase